MVGQGRNLQVVQEASYQYFALPAFNLLTQTIRPFFDLFAFLENSYYVNNKLPFVMWLVNLQQLILNMFFRTANIAATNFLNLLRPVLGEAFNRFHFYGTNSATWVPILLQNKPRDQLQEWLGGTKDFKPVRVFAWPHCWMVIEPIQRIVLSCTPSYGRTKSRRLAFSLILAHTFN